MMKPLRVALLVSVCAAWSIVQACEIENAENIEIGTNEGVQGTCSNNGQEISCYADESGGWTCEGPQGHYNAYGGLTESLIDEACGC